MSQSNFDVLTKNMHPSCSYGSGLIANFYEFLKQSFFLSVISSIGVFQLKASVVFWFLRVKAVEFQQSHRWNCKPCLLLCLFNHNLWNVVMEGICCKVNYIKCNSFAESFYANNNNKKKHSVKIKWFISIVFTSHRVRHQNISST